jgi:hypothetical protein
VKYRENTRPLSGGKEAVAGRGHPQSSRKYVGENETPEIDGTSQCGMDMGKDNHLACNIHKYISSDSF